MYFGGAILSTETERSFRTTTPTKATELTLTDVTKRDILDTTDDRLTTFNSTRRNDEFFHRLT
jgi:hypothetical protein